MAKSAVTQKKGVRMKKRNREWEKNRTAPEAWPNVNYPVPPKVKEDWISVCNGIDLTLEKDIAGLLVLATVVPADTHHLMYEIAYGRLPPGYARRILDRIRLAVLDALHDIDEQGD